MTPTIKPYEVSFSEDRVRGLREKLASASFPTQYNVEDLWQIGVPLLDLKRLTDHWSNGFDFGRAEARLNELPNFMTSVEVDGFGALDIHFVHQKSPVEGAIPLLFSHGWPGSFIEVTKLLPLLRDATDGPAFHVFAPSLPNFGFSSGVDKKGFTLTKYAETLHKLMLTLGYNTYVTQGGDWGSWITRTIGLQYSEHCKASHLNLVLGQQPQWTTHPLLALKHAISPYTATEREGMKRSTWFREEDYGYNLLQSTKPQTVGYALADSPVALLGWIYEKLHNWTDQYPWTDDEILTWVSIYWFSKAGPAASVRIYHEATHPQPQSAIGTMELRRWIPNVLYGFSHFPQELCPVPNTWNATLGTVCYERTHKKSGHFAAWECPEAIAEDVRNMFKKDGPCYGIVSGKDGYR